MSIAQRVARRFEAELLTKSWLMGIRRGWLSLLKPRIQDWDDVLRAIDALAKFADNLQEQVSYVRRAPLGDADKKRLSAVFAALKVEIKEQRSKALHWMRVHTGTTGMPTGTFTVEEAEKMLKLYQSNFAEVMTFWKGRERPLTDLIDQALAILRKEAATLKKHIDTERGQDRDDTKREWSDAAFKEFNYGRMKVVVQDFKANGHNIRAYVKHLDKAYQLLQRRGFQKLWYGVMFIESIDYKKLDANQVSAYEALGYKNLRRIAGRYHEGEDVFVLTQPPGKEIAETIVHELGHRYWYKFMGADQQAKFESLVKVHRPGKSAPLPKSIPEDDRKKLEKDLHEAVERVQKAVVKFRDDPRLYTTIFDTAEADILLEVNRYNAILTEGHGLMFSYGDVNHSEVVRYWEKAKKLYGELYSTVRSIWSVVDELERLPDMPRKDFNQEDQARRKRWAQKVFEASDNALDTALTAISASFVANLEYVNEAVKQKEPHFDPNDPRTVLPVSDYGKSHIREAFAEAFTWYVYGRDMTRDQVESFRTVLASQDPWKATGLQDCLSIPLD